MKIQEQDIYHGAALTQIVEHKSFKALNRGSEKYGHYLVNTNRHVFAKYRKTKRSPWVFQFNAHDVQALRDTPEAAEHVFLCLICGRSTVCALTRDEIEQLIDLSQHNSAQSIRVEVPKGGSCHVSGSVGSLKQTVPHNSFPDKIFV